MPDPAINARYGLDAGPFRRGMQDVTNKMRTAEVQTNRLTRATRGFRRILGTLGIGIGVGAFAMLIRRAGNLSNELTTASETIGVNVEQLQRLRFAEQQATGSTGRLEQAMQALGRRMVDQEDQFNQLGITTRDASGNFLDVRTVLGNVADAIQVATSDGERLAIAQQTMSTQGRQLVPVLRNGEAGLRAWGQQAEEAGRIIDEDTVAALNKANTQLKEFNDSLTIGAANFLQWGKDAIEGVAQVARAMGGLPSSEAEAREIQARAQAIRELLEREDVFPLGGGEIGVQERGRFGLVRLNEAKGRELIEQRVNEILNEQAERALRAERIAEEIRRRTEEEESARRKTRESAERQAAIERARVAAAKEIAAAYREFERRRKTEELPTAERILLLEEKIASVRDQAMALTDEEKRNELISEAIDMEQRILDLRAQQADMDRVMRERLAPTLAQVAESETPAGVVARRIQEAEDEARRLRAETFDATPEDMPDAPRLSEFQRRFFDPQRAQDEFREAQRQFAVTMEEFAERQRERLRGLIPDSEADPFEDMRRSSRESAKTLKEILDEMRQEEVA